MTTDTENNPVQIILDHKLGFAAAAPLAALLSEHRKKQVEIDASKVEMLGGSCLQVLLSAARTWRDESTAFRFVNQSPVFSECIERFGCSDDAVFDESYSE